MLKENLEIAKINKRWQDLMIRVCFIIDIIIFVVELVLGVYFIREEYSSHYNESTYWIFYLLIPTFVNFATTTLAWFLVNRTKISEDKKNHVVSYALLAICFVVATVHGYYPVVLGVYIIPNFVATVVGDRKFVKHIFLATVICLVASTALIPLFAENWSVEWSIVMSLITLVILVILFCLGIAISELMNQKDLLLRFSSIENNRMREEVSRDLMTGLYNHAEFFNRLDEYFKEPALRNKQLTVVMIDADNFKDINDNYGHLNGDIALISMARFIKEGVGKKGVVFRFGGEEFAVILPDISSEKAFEMFEELRVKISQIKFPFMKESQLTISVGIYTRKESDIEPNSIIEKADIAMYKAKKSTKNRCIIADGTENTVNF